VTVEHKEAPPRPDEVLIVYDVNLGPRRKVETVSVEGNHYFGEATLKQLLERTGRFADGPARDLQPGAGVRRRGRAQGVYQNNGFASVKVTPEMSREALLKSKENRRRAPRPSGRIPDRGRPQERVGSVSLDGNDQIAAENLLPLLNTEQGQLLSPSNLAGDRDMLATELHCGEDSSRHAWKWRKRAILRIPTGWGLSFASRKGDRYLCATCC